MQGEIELSTEAQQLRAAEHRLREMKANPWSEYNSYHCVMNGFEMKFIKKKLSIFLNFET